MKDFLKAIIYGGIFFVPCIVFIVTNDLFFPFITGKNFSFRIAVEILFAAWVILALLDAAYRPRWSWIMGGFGALLVVMFFANVLGAHPGTSFWSNYERMDGYVTLVHLFLYFVVAGSFLQTAKQWTWFWYASLGVATIVALNGVFEYLESPGRIAGMLGNAAYMAIYMLFHIFLVFYLFVRTENIYTRIGYMLLSVLFVFVLLQTGTRGTAIGLVTGMGTMVAYVAVFGRQNPEFRKYAIAATALFMVLVGSFFAFRDHAVVQESGTLSRIANIDLQADLEVRGTIWGMAWAGVQERPVLGWGQGNFSYVFNQEYDPFLYDQEQWFDRVHNIFLDWLVAGGVLGFVAYFTIFGAAIYYLARRQQRVPEAQRFTVLEQSALLGLLVAYLTHNLVVFDNIVSYVFYASLLAMIHARVGIPLPSIQKMRVTPQTVRDVVTPAVVVVLGATIYFVNVPGMQAASDIITAMRAPSVEQRLTMFETAMDRGSFAEQEIAEQFAQQAMTIAGTSEVPESQRETFVASAERALRQVADDKPNDARIRVFLGAFYRSVGEPVAAREQLDKARELSPRKASIIVQQGANELNLNDRETALAHFKTAYELDTRNQEAFNLYAALLFYTDRSEEAIELIADQAIPAADGEMYNPKQRRFAQDDFAVRSVHEAGELVYLTELYEVRVAVDATNPQDWASLAFLYYELGEMEAAIDALQRAGDAMPDFAPTADCFADNIASGRTPQEGC